MSGVISDWVEYSCPKEKILETVGAICAGWIMPFCHPLANSVGALKVFFERKLF